MATVTKWTPFGVALNITATAGTVTRTSATKFTVKINASWETHYSGAQTKYGMTASSGGGSVTLKKFSNTAASSGSGSFTGTYSISGNGSATKAITVTFRNFNDDNGDSATKSVSFNVTVPAWTSYTVKYDANGGTGAPANQTKWKGQSLALSSTKPTRTGYTFQGWDAPSIGASIVFAPGAWYSYDQSVTLYAMWKANTYTVKYDANGGTGAPANQTKTHGVTLTLSSTKPTRTNYNFLGWGVAANATVTVYSPGNTYTVNQAITLYAIWELAYTKPRISNVLLTRTTDDDIVSDDGTSARVTFDWSCDKTVSSIVVKWKPTTESTYSNSRTVPATGMSGSVHELIVNSFDSEMSYDIHITVTDAGGSSPATSILPSMVFVIDFMEGGKGAAIGKAAKEEGVFDIAFATCLSGGLSYPILEPDTDLNGVRTPNIYIGENVSQYNYVNCPITSGTFTLEVFSSGPNGQVTQRLTVCDKTKSSVYERFYYTSAWGEWSGGWIYPTLASGFAMYGASTSDNQTRYRKDGRLVEVRGIVTPAADIAGSTTVYPIFTLPTGYRPNSPIYVVCQGSGNCTWLLRVATNGEVGFSRYRNGDATATAAAGVWLPFQITFFNN